MVTARAQLSVPRKCPACGHLNRPQANWCASCKTGLNLGAWMMTPWAESGLGRRVNSGFLLLLAGCVLLFFLHARFAASLLLVIALAWYSQWRKSIIAACPHCGHDVLVARGKKSESTYSCNECGRTVRAATRSWAPALGKTAGDASPAPKEVEESKPAPPHLRGPVVAADWSGVDLAQGHPKVKKETVAGGVAYSVLHLSLVAWLGLAILLKLATIPVIISALGDRYATHTYFMGKEIFGHTLVHFLFLGSFFAVMTLGLLSFTAARYVVTLKPDLITVRWRVLPYLGWTWTLVPGAEVKVALAHLGQRVNRRPIPEVIVVSRNGEISFGGVLPSEVKAFLCAAIHDYYNVANSVGARQDSAASVR